MSIDLKFIIMMDKLNTYFDTTIHTAIKITDKGLKKKKNESNWRDHEDEIPQDP